MFEENCMAEEDADVAFDANRVSCGMSLFNSRRSTTKRQPPLGLGTRIPGHAHSDEIGLIMPSCTNDSINFLPAATLAGLQR